MEKEIYISTRGTTHAVALIKDGKLIEFNSENEKEGSIVGNIYKGKVEQVLKGMQAAFVNIGRKKNGYLYLSDTYIDGQDLSESQEIFMNKALEAKVGDEILVQVAKSEIGFKGARLTPNLSLAGRFVVYMPYINYVGISRKIVDEDERKRLSDIVENLQNKNGGYIIRTACQNATASEIISEIERLQRRFKRILNYSEIAPSKAVVWDDGLILERVVRDLVGKFVKKIVVDDESTYKKMADLLHDYGFSADILQLYVMKNIDLFNFYGITGQVLRILDSRVDLENGAYLIIENTEALTVIDVNTGSYVGNTSLEETVFETNCLAAKAIATQLRLRNIGGIIVVDFIDMLNEEHKEKLMEIMSEAVKKDRVRTSVISMTPLGLVEITRKKSRNEVKQTFSKPCKACGGRGFIMTNETLATVIRQQLFDVFAKSEPTTVLITVNEQNVKDFVINHAFAFEVSVFWSGKRIYVCSDINFANDEYDIKCFETEVVELPTDAKILV